MRTHAPTPVDVEHVRRVVNWSVSPQLRSPITPPADAFTIDVRGDTVELAAPDARRARRTAEALTSFGYRVSRDRLGVVVERFTPHVADHAGTPAPEWQMLLCPGCGDPFPAPTDAAGALVDCSSCPWRGHAPAVTTKEEGRPHPWSAPRSATGST